MRTNGKQRFCDDRPWRQQAGMDLSRPPLNPFAVELGGHHSLAPFSLTIRASPLLPSPSFCRALATGCMWRPKSQRGWTRTEMPDQTEVRDGAAI